MRRAALVSVIGVMTLTACGSMNGGTTSSGHGSAAQLTPSPSDVQSRHSSPGAQQPTTPTTQTPPASRTTSASAQQPSTAATSPRTAPTSHRANSTTPRRGTQSTGSRVASGPARPSATSAKTSAARPADTELRALNALPACGTDDGLIAYTKAAAQASTGVNVGWWDKSKYPDEVRMLEYDACAPLSAEIGEIDMMAMGNYAEPPQQVFFFHNGVYFATATPHTVGSVIELARLSPNQIQVTWQWQRTAPGVYGRSATSVYTWTSSGLTRTGELPSGATHY